MFFRFGSALVLVVLISLAGTALEKRNLELRRKASLQHFRLEKMLDLHAEYTMKAQQLGAPQRLIEQIDADAVGEVQSAEPPKPAPKVRPPRRKKSRDAVARSDNQR